MVDVGIWQIHGCLSLRLICKEYLSVLGVVSCQLADKGAFRVYAKNTDNILIKSTHLTKQCIFVW